MGRDYDVDISVLILYISHFSLNHSRLCLAFAIIRLFRCVLSATVH